MHNVYVEQCSDYKELFVDKAIQKLFSQGNFGKTLKRGMKVLVEPNCLSAYHPKKAITTHPLVVKAVVKELLKLSTRPVIGDQPFNDDVWKTYKKNGIKKIADELKVPLVAFSKGNFHEFKTYKLLKGVRMVSWIDKVDAIVSIPKLKCHCQMYFTGATKGTYSLVLGPRRGLLHLKSKDDWHLSHVMLDIFHHLQPKLKFAIMDGIVGLEGDGPSGGGDPKFAGFLAGSTNYLALDHVAMRLIGLIPEKSAIDQHAQLRPEFSFGAHNIKVVGNTSGITAKFREPAKAEVNVMPKFLNEFTGWLFGKRKKEISLNF